MMYEQLEFLNKPRVKTANAISQQAYINKTDLKSGPWDALGNNSTPNKTINLKLSDFF